MRKIKVTQSKIRFIVNMSISFIVGFCLCAVIVVSINNVPGKTESFSEMNQEMVGGNNDALQNTNYKGRVLNVETNNPIYGAVIKVAPQTYITSYGNTPVHKGDLIIFNMNSYQKSLTGTWITSGNITVKNREGK